MQFIIKYIDYPWPKKNSFSQQNEKNENIPINDETGEVIYYIPHPSNICMYSKSPCTHVLKLKIKKKKFLNFYDMFYLLSDSS